jgi:hypothetical protein
MMLGRAQQIIEGYADQLPLTIRQLYYRMVAEWHYTKGKAFEESFYDMMVSARRSGDIPFWQIRDDGIVGGGYWPGMTDFLYGRDLELGNYQTDRQHGQDMRLEVWCEAAGMRPQLARVADDYSIPVYSCGGFDSLTAIRQIVDSVASEDRDTVVLHLGDYDPSGVSLFDRMVEDVQAFLLDDAPERSFTAVRVALTESQITEHALPMDLITTDDTRSKAWKAAGKLYKCELEALSPSLIASTLRETIEARIDPNARAATLDREGLERAALKSLPYRDFSTAGAR